MNRSDGIRQDLQLWAMILGLWTLMVLAFAGQLVFAGSMEWQQALRHSFHDWFPWVFLAPVTAFLASRFPLERGRLVLSVPVHLIACVVVVAICELFPRPLPRPAAGQFSNGQPRFSVSQPGGGRELNRPPVGNPQLDPEGFGGDQPPPLQAGNLNRPEGRPLPFMNALVMRGRFNVPIYWVVVSIVNALTFYRRSEDRQRQTRELESRLTEARLDALRMQLHPHFLFNTLNAISTLVHKDPNAADEMIANLSDLLRAALDTQEPRISLRRELEFLDRYLAIQQVRFGDRLRVGKELDAAALDIQVPALILQPLAENAVRHGIEPMTRPGRVLIKVSIADRMLRMVVSNDGVPQSSKNARPEGIGLSNTRARLEALYGDRARLLLNSGSDGSFSVELHLPISD